MHIWSIHICMYVWTYAHTHTRTYIRTYFFLLHPLSLPPALYCTHTLSPSLPSNLSYSSLNRLQGVLQPIAFQVSFSLKCHPFSPTPRSIASEAYYTWLHSKGHSISTTPSCIWSVIQSQLYQLSWRSEFNKIFTWTNLHPPKKLFGSRFSDPVYTLLIDLYYWLWTKVHLSFSPIRVSRGWYPLVFSGRVRHPLDSN